MTPTECTNCVSIRGDESLWERNVWTLVTGVDICVILLCYNVTSYAEMLLYVTDVMDFTFITYGVKSQKNLDAKYKSKVKLRLLYCHPPQLRLATPGL